MAAFVHIINWYVFLNLIYYRHLIQLNFRGHVWHFPLPNSAHVCEPICAYVAISTLTLVISWEWIKMVICPHPHKFLTTALWTQIGKGGGVSIIFFYCCLFGLFYVHSDSCVKHCIRQACFIVPSLPGRPWTELDEVGSGDRCAQPGSWLQHVGCFTPYKVLPAQSPSSLTTPVSPGGCSDSTGNAGGAFSLCFLSFKCNQVGGKNDF